MTFPIMIPTYITAVETAREISKQLSDRFIYLYRLTAGGYLIDHLDLEFDNQKHIKTFKNGQITL